MGDVLRETVFWRGEVEGMVITYKIPGIDDWYTNLFVFGEEENPGILNAACKQDLAEHQHDEAVRMLRVMGFEIGDKGK
jgi:hypothetical protein